MANLLSAEEKSRLSVALYGAGTSYRSLERYAWEDGWLSRRLPPARDLTGRSTRVLVGAAGAGREVVALLERGHEVVALEPSAELAALCRERTGARVIEARYEDAARDPSVLMDDAPFDAALLGLGSLSHVLEAEMRVQVLRAVATACPAGPILVSALTAPRRGVPSRGRAARMGRAVARHIRAARHLPDVEEGEVVFGALGFARLLSRGELAALAAALDRRPLFDDDTGAPDGLALCTLLPPER